MSASDARPVPRKNVAWRLPLAIRKNDGTLATGWTSPDTELSLDGGAFADATNEITEIGSSGCGYLDLTAGEMNADSVIIKITISNAGALPLVITVFPEEAGDYRGQVSGMDANVMTAAAAAADLTTELQAGLATAAALAIVAGYLDTEIAAIKAKTDQLTFTVANQVDANALTGGGSTESALLQSTTIATLTSQTVFTLTAGSADNDAYNGCLVVLTDQATAAQKSVALVLDYVGSTRTLTLSRAPAFTIATGDSVKILAADSGDLAVTLVAALRSGVVTVRKPISDDGTLELVRGDTYDDWVNPAIVWQVATSTDISAAIATMTVSVKGTKLATTGTVTAAGAGLWDITFEPAVPSDYPLGEGKYDFELKSVAGTNVATPETGICTIKQDVTRPA